MDDLVSLDKTYINALFFAIYVHFHHAKQHAHTIFFTNRDYNSFLYLCAAYYSTYILWST